MDNRGKKNHKIFIINGPNLNLTGIREPKIYGNQTFESLWKELEGLRNGIELEYFQSNIEGVLVDKIQQAGFDNACAGIILNPGGYTHTSIAIADAVAAVQERVPVVEVHLSNILGREEFRRQSLTAPYCTGVITGFGLESYRLAYAFLVRKIQQD